MKWVGLFAGILLSIVLLVVFLRPPRASSGDLGKVILIGIDAGTLPRVRELAGQGRLPNFARLLSEGAVGHLASIYASLPFSPRRGSGYWSPLVWASIATGKDPAAHGIIDFRLPYPSAYRICTKAEVRTAEVNLPPQDDRAGVRIVRAPGSGRTTWTVRPGNATASFEIPVEGKLDIPLSMPSVPPGAVTLEFQAGAGPSEPLCLQSLGLLDPNGHVTAGIDFVANRRRFTSGWTDPRVGKLRLVGTDFRRVRAIWNILSERGRRVAVVGWHSSWPAERVNGYFVSDRVGWRPAQPSDVESSPLSRLTFPDELERRARPYVDRFPEIDALADRTILSVAPCTLDDFNARVAKIGFSSDWLRHELALKFWDDDRGLDFLAVYYAGIDTYGHLFLGRQQAREPGCAIGPALVDRYLGDWLERLPAGGTLVIVSDHGMVSGEVRGEHADTGLVIMAGKNVSRGATVREAHVFDIAPTVLYLLNLPLASDLRGRPLWSGLDPGFRQSHPLRRIATYEKGDIEPHPVEPPAKGEEERIRQLRALGYIN